MSTAEPQRTPIETKLRQLAALMAARHLFGPESDRERQVAEVRDRCEAPTASIA
jgi:hypothetical protein